MEVSLVVAMVCPGEENDSVVLVMVGRLDTGQEVAVVVVPWQ